MSRKHSIIIIYMFTEKDDFKVAHVKNTNILRHSTCIGIIAKNKVSL